MDKYVHNPLGFVYYAFPWGESGELEDYPGPELWQIEVLEHIGKRLKAGKTTAEKAISSVIRLAISAGNGPGKSALVSWLILWAMSTFEDTRGVVTANTETQLKTKTWAELAKWHRLCITKPWFVLTATAIYAKDKEHERTWRIDQIPWSEEKPEAFAGLHNKGKRLLVVFDEASAIPDKIWEAAEGAMTDKKTEIIWLVSGNPTRNTGRFKLCWGKLRHRWQQWQLDIRKSKLVNQEEVRQWIEDLGIDSDWVRVHVLGLFPSASDLQFISNYLAEGGAGRKLGQNQYTFAPKVLGLDSAWTGGDEIVIALRQGLASKICKKFKKNDDDNIIAAWLMKCEDEEQADAVFIDFAYGTGIYSIGKNLKRNWVLVNFGSGSTNPLYLNKRAQMWGDMRQWLIEGGSIEDKPEIIADLTGPEAQPNLKGKIQLESKKQMKARGLASPGNADALALTFAHPVKKRVINAMGQEAGLFAKSDYDVLAPQGSGAGGLL